MGHLRKDHQNARKWIRDYDAYHCMGTLYLVRAPNSIAYNLEERVFVSVEVEWNILQGGLTADEAASLIAEFPDKVSYWNPIPKGEVMGHYDDCREYDRQNPRSQPVPKKTPKMTEAEQTILAWFELTKEERQTAARSLLEQGQLELDDYFQLRVAVKRPSR